MMKTIARIVAATPHLYFERLPFLLRPLLAVLMLIIFPIFNLAGVLLDKIHLDARFASRFLVVLRKA